MTFRPRISCALLLALALGAFAGCSDDDGPTVPNPVSSQADADDVAIQAGIAFDNLTTMLQASAGAPSGPVGFRTPPVGTNAGGGGFTTASDTTFTRGAITFQLSRRWFDAARVEQTVPDATTDSLVVTTRAFGADSTSTARYRVVVGHAGQLRVGGLVATRPIYTIAGGSADTLDSRFTSLSGVTRTFYAWLIGVATGVQIPKASPTGYPTTGTVRWVVHAERTRSGDRGNVEKTLDATVTLTFNGTRYPNLVVNATWGYVLDLETGAVTRGGGA